LGLSPKLADNSLCAIHEKITKFPFSNGREYQKFRDSARGFLGVLESSAFSQDVPFSAYSNRDSCILDTRVDLVALCRLPAYYAATIHVHTYHICIQVIILLPYS